MIRSIEALSDDGAGQIPCPLRGVMAIQRCRERQAETERDGRACTCPVFRAYDGQREPAQGALGTNARRCGTAIEVTSFIAGGGTPIVRLPVIPQEAPHMATRPKTGGACARCSKPAPAGTKIRDGLCKPCRIGDIKAAQQRSQERQAAASQPTAPATKQTIIPAVAEQEVARLQKQLEKATAEIARLNTRLEKITWLADGVQRGWIAPEQLAQAASSAS